MYAPYDSAKERELVEFVTKRTGIEQFTPGLDRISPLFAPLVALAKERGVKIVTIAGTNGKGETAMTLSYLLASAGHHVATWTSPHILSMRERFSYDASPISYEKLEATLAMAWDEIILSGITVSYYEFLFYSFCRFALSQSLEFIVLEVGLGGRFDAVNLFDADYAAITSIARDHQAILGNSYRKILGEKIGVARSGRPLLSFYTLGYLRQQTEIMSEKIGAIYRDLGQFLGDENDYSKRNRYLAAALYGQCIRGDQFDLSQTKAILQSVTLPTFTGRKERVTRGERSFIFIGAHNVEGMRVLLSSGMTFEHGLLAFSSRPLPDIAAAIKIAGHICKSLMFTCFDHPKALKEEQLFSVNGHLPYTSDWRGHIDHLCSIPGETVVMGSYYFIGEVQKYFATE